MSELLGREHLTPMMHEYEGIPEFYGLPLQAHWRLIDILTETKPQRILVFGCGIYIGVLARYHKAMPNTVITVVDQAERWDFERRKNWSDNGVALNKMDVRVARMLSGTFDVDDFKLTEPYDLVLVDSPRVKEKRGDAGFISKLREVIVPQRTTIILDDTHVEAVAVLRAAILEHLGSWNVSQEVIVDGRVVESYRTTTILHPLPPSVIANRCDICMIGWNNHPERLKAFERTLRGLRLNWTAYEPTIWMAQETRGLLDEDIKAVEDVGARYGVTVLNNPIDHSWVHNKQLSWSRSTAPYILFLEDDWCMQWEFDIRWVTDWLDEHQEYQIVNLRQHHPKSRMSVACGGQQYGDFFERLGDEAIYTCTPHVRRNPMPIFNSDKLQCWEKDQDGSFQVLENGQRIVFDAEIAYLDLLQPLFDAGELRCAAFNHLYLFEHNNEAVAKKPGRVKQEAFSQRNQS